MGVITGGTAFAVLGAVGLALAAVAAVLVLFSVVEGERERSVGLRRYSFLIVSFTWPPDFVEPERGHLQTRSTAGRSSSSTDDDASHLKLVPLHQYVQNLDFTSRLPVHVADSVDRTILGQCTRKETSRTTCRDLGGRF